MTTGKIRPDLLAWRTATFRARTWAFAWFFWTSYYLSPLLTGWLLKLVFDRLAEAESVSTLLVTLGIAESASWVVFAISVWFVVRWWVSVTTMVRTNMLHAQTVSGGPRAAKLPSSPSEAITRFRDDTRDTVIWADSWLDGGGIMLYGIGALIIMATINVGAALVALAPLVVVTVVTRHLTPRLYAARAADRRAAATVNSFLGEMFAGMLAFRLAGREEAAIHRLETHTSHRRHTAVRDTVLQQAIDGMASSTADVTIGLTLLVLVPSMRDGSLSVGDIALFVAYAVQLGRVPRFAARLVTAREQAIVAYERMGEMMPQGQVAGLVERCEVTIERRDRMRTRDADPDRVGLDRLNLRGLTTVFADTGGGVRGIELSVPAGAFVVVTGEVGSGKSTLLRAIAGLEDLDDGAIEWNGHPIDDVAAWMVPPQAAYLPQIPRLFSESIAANVRLGRDHLPLDDVFGLTTLTADLAEMADGAETRVGARGLRLSGGQAQRVATARSLLSQPELLLIDDVSSALDVATELELWTSLRGQGTSTIIAVSHRQLAFDLADAVITLSDGRIV
ncbi:MAG: ABC transporter ATP-binding protein [Actinomycetia bacterium]|nr:ABC transporter ATP-binding protein [Actinomycetes bacterium]MCP4958967.1 ABC transporter ATP-binding protein [Actinomycetes bacterium]